MTYTFEFIDERTKKPIDGGQVAKTWYGMTEEKMIFLAIGWACGLKARYKHPVVIVRDEKGTIVRMQH